MKSSLSVICFIQLLSFLIVSQVQSGPIKQGNPKYPDGLFVELHTSKGKIVLALEFEKTPLTVANFVGLAEGTKKSNKPKGTPFYDGIIFHRVIKGFMIQGGDPEGSGRGGPGYRFPDEFHPNLKHTGPGIMSMANAGPATNGSQFFITHKATPHLNGRHTVFGHVIDGMEVLDAIANVEVSQGSNRPLEDVVINKAVIVRNGKKARAFKADQVSFDALVQSHGDRIKEQQEKKGKKRQLALKKFLNDLEKKYPGKLITSKSGLKYVVTQKGKGKKPSKGTAVQAHYNGTFLDGKKFDSSYDRGKPLKFGVGTRRVIPGWDEAFLDMKKGEKRILVVPPNLAYGSKQTGSIPPNSTLIFDVELVDF